MNFKYSFVTCLLKYIFTVSIANCVFAYNTLLSMFVKNDKNVALALKELNDPTEMLQYYSVFFQRCLK